MQFNKAHKVVFTAVLIIISSVCFAEYFAAQASYELCFTPGNNCAAEIIKAIAMAKKQVLVQVYSFTDADIADALVKAKRKGVEVKVILDKTQINAKYSQNRFLERNGIKILIDHKPSIAHNKVIIVDNHAVLGGSYNYTASAAKRNAENLLIIKDAKFAQKYVNNWYARERESILMADVLSNTGNKRKKNN